MKKMEHLFLGTLLVVLLAMAGCDQGLGVSSGLPALTGSVTITGDVRVGATLTAAPDFGELAGTVASLDKTYTWKRSGTGSEENSEWLPIEGASDGTYTPSAEDVDNYIKVEVGVTGYRGALSGTTEDVVLEAGGVPAPAPQESLSFASEEYTVDVQADMENWSDTNWTLNVLEAGTVYFAVNKAAGYTIEVGGDDAARVKQAESGTTVTEATAGGLTAGAELAVFTVDTRDLVFDGGTRNFTLGDVAVTLNVLRHETGAALFTVEWPDSFEYADKSAPANFGKATLTRVDTGESAFNGVLPAITWVENNAVDNTEYLLRVENSGTGDNSEIHLLPKLILAFNNQNVTLRLRGTTEGGPKVLKWDGATTPYNKLDIKNLVTTANNNTPFIQIYKGASSEIKRTLILENNITVKGIESNSTGRCIYVCYNAMLVLRKGAVITGHGGESNSGIPINIAGANPNNTKTGTKHGKLRIEGGSITDCRFEGNNLIVMPVATVVEDGSFYMAASTDENPIVISGNSKNQLRLGGSTNYQYNLDTDYISRGIGLTLPPLPASGQ